MWWDRVLFEIPLNKYIYGFVSIFRAPGRFFLVCYYLILIYGITIIYKSFKRRNSIFFLLILLGVQIADISVGLKEYINGKSFNSEKIVLNDPIWKIVEKNYEIISSTYLINQSNTIHLSLSSQYFIESHFGYFSRIFFTLLPLLRSPSEIK